jgi:N-acetylneuraminate synthase
MQAWKIASGELTTYPMIERLMKTEKPVLISSGMSEMEEVDALVNKVKSEGIEFGVFQCTSSYPTPPEKVGLNMLSFYKDRYGCPVGLSDHSGSIFPSLAGVALGMEMLEIHVAFSRDTFGPDVIASVTLEEMKQLVDGVRFTERMIQNPIVKDEMAESLKTMKGLFNKSIVAGRDIEAGTVLTENHFAYKKPGTGLSAKDYQRYLGKRLNKSVEYNHFFEEGDFE